MPNEFRVTFLFEGFMSGWSETHIFSRQETDPGAVANALLPLAQKRANMLGRDYLMIGYRVKFYRDAAGNRVKRTAFPVLRNFNPANQTASNSGDPNFVSARALGSDSTGNHITRVFFGGIPDACSVDGGAFDPSKPAADPFQNRFDTWVGESIVQG